MRRSARQEGLTLIEVMVAVSLFIVLMLAVTSALPTLFRLDRETTTVQANNVYARNVIDQTRALWMTPTGSLSSDQDHYPDLTTGKIPTNLPAVPAGLSCVAPPQTEEIAKMEAPTSTSTTPVYWTTRRKITVSCRAAGSTQAYTNFVAEIGRPE